MSAEQQLGERGGSEGGLACAICGTKMVAGATFCTACKHYQSLPRRFLAGINLHALVTLIPVAALAFVFVKDNLLPHSSDVRAFTAECEQDGIGVVVSNVGDRIAIVRGATFLPNGSNQNKIPLMLAGEHSLGVFAKPDEPIKLVMHVAPVGGVSMPMLPIQGGESDCSHSVALDVLAHDHSEQQLVAACPCSQ